ncbi:uncharacterized protein EV420DRAFT_1473965 [Desarmillaria tabescens]|uniref:Uncharacterized protein n=1 Tax=Armillaria tabescens TaxID=1929756 RepID=A0AA39NM99_ARMTA|nr:uncharacterized protein EV420DRAFT_1473965 [Desarmillaria tabescens]KAK0468258.1 hypothetical protein EV420DRAFT_1473965 [Desarmillaria tabescens]
MSHRLARPLRHLTVPRVRYSSSSVKRKPTKQVPTLPPEKLRALISVYHGTESFVTPENLSDRIDDAFVRSVGDAALNSFKKYDNLRKHRLAQRDMAELWEWDLQIAVGNPAMEEREAKIVEALYGVDTSDPLYNRYPGLDLLQDAERGPSTSKDVKSAVSQAEPLPIPEEFTEDYSALEIVGNAVSETEYRANSCPIPAKFTEFVKRQIRPSIPDSSSDEVLL